MSKKISSFKKELLIRIALFLETMAKEDLDILEEVIIDNLEGNDPEVRRLLVELFQEKYQIDLGANLTTMVED